jgi:hypothetical protein
MGGQIVDATLVAAPRERNTADQKAAIKAGKKASAAKSRVCARVEHLFAQQKDKIACSSAPLASGVPKPRLRWPIWLTTRTDWFSTSGRLNGIGASEIQRKRPGSGTMKAPKAFH